MAQVENDEVKRSRKKKGRYILLAVEIIVLLVMIGVLIYVIVPFTNPNTGVDKVNINPEDVLVTDPATASEDQNGENLSGEETNAAETTGAMDNYWNIALFGVDSRQGKLTTGTRTDTIIIASINKTTKEVKLVSVYRDTYLYIAQSNSDGTLKDYTAANTYNKCNAAYAYGGAKEALRMLNMNLGLNITDFCTVGFDALTDTVDGLGGLEINVAQEEIVHLNNYQISTVGETDDNINFHATEGVDYIAVTEPGLQTLNGLQTTAWCRIRYIGSDFARTAHQREVVTKIAEKAKKTDLATLTTIANDVMSEVYTSFSLDDVISLLGGVGDYEIVDNTAFPFNLGTAEISGAGECLVPVTLADNVVELHKYLFEDEEYVVSETIQTISDMIEQNTEDYIR